MAKSLLDNLNKRLMLNNKFKRRTIEIYEKDWIFHINNEKFQQHEIFWKEKENNQGQNE